MISVVKEGHFNEIRGTASILFLLFFCVVAPPTPLPARTRGLNASHPLKVFAFAPFPQLV